MAVLRYTSTCLSVLPGSVQLGAGALNRLWFYLNHKVTIGNIEVSVTSFITGILVLVLSLLVGRAVTTLLEHRISKRHYIDPGIR